MKIGFTYDLQADYLAEGFSHEETAEFDQPETIDAIETALKAGGHDLRRIGGVRALSARLAAGERWDLVFNIAEGFSGFGREAQVPALLDAYEIPYTFSDPLVLALTLHKAFAKRVVRDLGLPTPDFEVVESVSDVGRIRLPFPLFAKPVAEGTGKGIDVSSKIETRSALESVCLRLLDTFKQPVLVETFLPGRELTVGILGTGKEAAVVGTMEILLGKEAEANGYSYHNKENYQELVTYRPVADAAARQAEKIALAVWRGLGCRDAGRIDLRLDAEGLPGFMEVNPLAGLHPVNSDLCIIAGFAKMTYTALIDAIVRSAARRISSPPDRRQRPLHG